MTISTSLFYDRAASRIAALGGDAGRLQDRISTGKKLAAPSDDAVAYQRLQTIARSTADDTAYRSNIALAQTVLAQADTVLGNVTNQLQRAQELAIQANSGTLSDRDRGIIATQIRGLVDDLVSLANTKDARGGPLFGSASGDTALNRDASGVVSFTGTGNPASIPVGDGVSVQASEPATRIFGGIASGGATTDILTLLSNFATALETPGAAATSAGAATAIDGLKAALDQVGSVRGSIGARATRLDLESARLDDTNVARQAERSRLEDTDVTQTVIDLQKTSAVLEATQSSLVRLSQLSLFDYLR